MFQPAVIADRDTFDAAAALLAEHGGAAIAEAERRAVASRNVGNVQRFCRWRQAGRLLAALASPEVVGRLN